MIIAKLTRYLKYGDVATLEIQLPFAPFIGLAIEAGVSEPYDTFMVSGIRYNPQTGATWLGEQGRGWGGSIPLAGRPSSEWIEEMRSKNEAERVARIKEYEDAGWTVKRSAKASSVSYNYRP